MQPERLAEAKLGINSSFQQVFTVPGSGDPGEEADAIPALIGFILQGLAEHGWELGPYLKALVTTERFYTGE